MKIVPARFGRSQGSLLVLALWLVVIMAVLAVSVARYLSLEIRLVKYRDAREQASALARSGIYAALQELERDATPAVDSLGDGWALPHEPVILPGGSVAVTILDEERKLSLNRASVEVLARAVGSGELAQAIVDYRDEPEDGEDEAAKNGPWVRPEELYDLPQMTGDRAEAFPLLLDMTSAYLPSDAALNINTAAPEVLEAAGLSDYTVAAIQAYREGPDGPDAHAQDGVFESVETIVPALQAHGWDPDAGGQPLEDQTVLGQMDVGSETFAVSATGAADRPAVRVTVEAVVKREGCGEEVPAPCIVAWREG